MWARGRLAVEWYHVTSGVAVTLSVSEGWSYRDCSDSCRRMEATQATGPLVKQWQKLQAARDLTSRPIMNEIHPSLQAHTLCVPQLPHSISQRRC